MIERYQLRYFLAVVEAGNFSRAAAQVNVTQPTLSAGIAKLEAEAGARLFLRNSKRVELTEAGARMLDHARTIEAEFHGLEVGGALGEGPRILRIGVLSSLPLRLLDGVVAAAGRDLAIELVEGAERDLAVRLQRGRLDVAVSLLRTEERRFAQRPLFEEGYGLAIGPTHWCRGRPEVAGEALGAETMIVRRHCEVLPQTSRYFTERGVRPRFAYRGANDERVLALVRGGLGVTVMPDCYAPLGEAPWPRLEGFAPRRRIGLLYAGDSEARFSGSPVLDSLEAIAP